MGLSLGELEKKTGDAKLVERARLSLGCLEKTSQSAGVDLTNNLLECGLLIDSSGSLSHAYYDGSIQETGECTLAWIAMVDSSGAAEAGFWDSQAHKPQVISLDNYRGWVKKNQPSRFGGTNLYDAIVMGAKMAAGALNAPQILDLIMAEVPDENSSGGGLFGRRSGGTKQQPGLNTSGGHYLLGLNQLKPIKLPKLYHLTIITDGASLQGPRPIDGAIKELIVRLSYAGIFIKLIFVGDDRDGREFLELLDDMPVAKHRDDPHPKGEDVDWYPGARYIDNVDKVEFVQGLGNVKPAEFAAAMTQELDTFVPSAVRRDLLDARNLVAA